MDTREINKFLSSLKEFKGTFPLDRIPKTKTFPAAMVINTHPSSLPGEHWVSIYINKHKQGQFFDPYGIPPLKEELIRYLNNNCISWDYYKTPIQSLEPTSNVCGNICIIFLCCKSAGLSDVDISEIFKFRELNDSIAKLTTHVLQELKNNA